jgi:hypothetical protein
MRLLALSAVQPGKAQVAQAALAAQAAQPV